MVPPSVRVITKVSGAIEANKEDFEFDSESGIWREV
jgi:hypothetical protein